MPGHADHKHFMCPHCETGFCGGHPDYAEMKEGDNCPNCHLDVVKEIPLLEVPGPENMIIAAVEAFKPLFEKQERERRAARLLDVAAGLYETGMLGDNEKVGISRAVEDAFALESAIRAKLQEEQ